MYGDNGVNICICDDEICIHDKIKSFLAQLTATETQPSITDVLSGEDLLNKCSSHNAFDIIFLDTEMTGIGGIRTAEELRKRGVKSIIIFISDQENYVFDVFKYEAFHFMIKPLRKDEFDEVFLRAVRKYKDDHRVIALKCQNERYVIPIREITFVEGYQRHIMVHTEHEVYESTGKISDILNKLENHDFIRVHQGFIVNMAYIRCFNNNDIVLQNGTKVMISIRKRSEALKVYDSYLQKNICLII